jgi:hypothetical protein
MFNAGSGDHFYTTSANEANNALQNTGPNISIATMLNTMRQVYDTVGILVDLGSTENISAPEAVDINIGGCTRGNTTGEQRRLFKNRNNASSKDIVVFYVRTTNPPTNGCAAHPDGKPSAIVTQGATRFTLGHEVGHVLDLNHVNNNDRLMTGNGTANITNPPPDLTNAEARTMDQSSLTVNI